MLWPALPWVVVLVVTVVLVVELLGPLLRLVLGLLLVDVVGTVGLGKPIYTGTSEAGKDFLGERMIDLLA